MPQAEGHALVHGLEMLGRRHGRLLVAVGAFDGLHRGHLYLLRHLREAARRLDARPAVLTFDHHPDEILRGAAPPVLCDPEERLVRLERAGVAVTIVEHFDAALRVTPYETFVEQIRAGTELAGFLMTPDAAFGHERRGTPETLAELGRRDGFDVVVVPPLHIDGRPVRSTVIREAIADGDLAAASRLLGRRVSVAGDRSPAEGGERLRFALPVALPPAGRYGARVEPAWRPSTGAPGPLVGGHADVGRDPDLVTVGRRGGLPAADRLRVAFVAAGAPRGRRP
jgi:riboflavin kinase/FMN adenylyltransferase